MGRLESSVALFFATAAIAALKKFDVDPAMAAFFRLALTTVAVKSWLPNFPHRPLACIIHEATRVFSCYVFICSTCGEFMVNPEITDCLLTLGDESSCIKQSNRRHFLCRCKSER